KDFEFHFIELQKFNKTECELDGIIDQWIYFLKIAEEGEIPKNRIEEILEAYQTVQESNFTKREVEVMQWWEMRDLSNRNQALKEGLEEGRKEGLLEGMEKGMEKGMENALIKLINNGIKEKEAKKILGF
ncbi:MAG: PD-(D/E)XK nuclease family transposase, partial [Candidatus Gracilibacteria bacterium]|nr:PD-(D/E)XK nuclease family transposase [Candidatus Gracilibacteria bacterium]